MTTDDHLYNMGQNVHSLACLLFHGIAFELSIISETWESHKSLYLSCWSLALSVEMDDFAIFGVVEIQI